MLFRVLILTAGHRRPEMLRRPRRERVPDEQRRLRRRGSPRAALPCCPHPTLAFMDRIIPTATETLQRDGDSAAAVQVGTPRSRSARTSSAARRAGHAGRAQRTTRATVSTALPLSASHLFSYHTECCVDVSIVHARLRRVCASLGYVGCIPLADLPTDIVKEGARHHASTGRSTLLHRSF
jgi:hypothetical protein